MPELVSERTRSILATSLPIVRQHRDEIVAAMEVYLRRVDEDRKSLGPSDVLAMILTDLLLRQADRIVDSRSAAGLDTIASEHRSLEIDGRHYSRFGDALVPILRDVLGVHVPREVPAAWCDTFWALIRAAQPSREPVEA